MHYCGQRYKQHDTDNDKTPYPKLAPIPSNEDAKTPQQLTLYDQPPIQRVKSPLANQLNLQTTEPNDKRYLVSVREENENPLR